MALSCGAKHLACGLARWEAGIGTGLAPDIGRAIGYIAFGTGETSASAGDRGERGRRLDNLTMALCLSIGTGVPWLIAIYSENGARQLIENNVLGLVGTAFGASAFNWISPRYGIIALISLGPVLAFLTIAAGQAVKRAILSRLSRSSCIPILALAAVVQLVPGAPSAQEADIRYLAPAGAPAKAFPRFERPVAEIVSPSRSTEAARDENGEAQQLAQLMKLRSGSVVGDIGAGAGYHTVRLSRVVGPSGTVVAQDVRQDYLTYLAKRVQKLKLTNVKIALGEPHDPRLPAASLDAAILVHMYHEIAEPYAFFYNLAPALKPGARVGIVDLDRPTQQHGTPPQLLRCELAAVGYRELSFHALTGDAGYLAIFEPPRKRPQPSAIVPCRQ